MRKTSFTEDEAASLNESFIAEVETHIAQLNRLCGNLPRSQRPSGIVANREQLAKLVKPKVHNSLRSVSNYLHNNGLPRSFDKRGSFIGAVEDVLREQYELVGATFEGSFDVFINPVQHDDDEGDDVDPGQLRLFEDWMRVRPGAWMADQRVPEHMDTFHHYLELFRQDMLDYETGDFYSIRRLRGRNNSRRPSFDVPYRESSERKFTFDEAAVQAFDFRTREELEVEPEIVDESSHTHPFRIRFPSAVAPGQTFDVVYNIRLPGELNELRGDSEVMSVSLVRITQGVAKLVFNVATNFKPTGAGAYHLRPSGSFVAVLGRPPTVEPYRAKHWFEDPTVFGIEWSCERPYIIRWQTTKPSGRMYVINFRGTGSENPLARRGR